ncbi:MAG: VCBS repeat-containing protein [Candidatus Pacearchaeota archaeon]
MKEEKNERSYFISTYLLLGVSIMWFSFLQWSFKPDSVYIKDINGDNRPDIVVTTKRGDKFIYLQQNDGSYKSLNEVQKSRTIEDKVDYLK